MTALSMRRALAAAGFVLISLGATGAVSGGAAIVGAVPGVSTVLHVAGVLPPVERPVTDGVLPPVERPVTIGTLAPAG
jgi:hypothetical protein